MRSTSLREYSAPELEVVSTIVEQGFTLSARISDAGVNEYDEEF